MNNNVELGSMNAFKFFPFGISNIIRKIRRVDGGWHIAMARHLHVYFCNIEDLSLANKTVIGMAYNLLYAAECGLCERFERESLMNKEVLSPLVRQLSLSRAF